MKLTETAEELKATFKDGDFPIVIIDGSRKSLLLAQIMQGVRIGTPLMIFPEYWSDEQRSLTNRFIENLGVRAYFMSPTFTISDGKAVEIGYQTNQSHICFRLPYTDEMFEKVLMADAGPQMIPSFLWTHMLIGETSGNFASGAVALFPLKNWTQSDLEEAYRIMQTPEVPSKWPEMVTKERTQWLSLQ